jgi:hypothetical protein
MTGINFTKAAQRPPGAPPPLPRFAGWGGFSRGRTLAALVAALVVIYLAYFWLVRRVVVHHGQVMVLLKKDGSRSLPGDQIIIPRPPDPKDKAAYAEWDKQYGDCNGILEQVYLEGTYFGFSPWDYERHVIDVGAATIPSDKVGRSDEESARATAGRAPARDAEQRLRQPVRVRGQAGAARAGGAGASRGRGDHGREALGQSQ